VNKTLLGQDQLKWLKEGLLNSKATWKVISDDDPITIASCDEKESLHTPRGCDNWATDGKIEWSFTAERDGFMRLLDDNNIKNVIFVTTEVPLPANIMINEDPNHDGRKLTEYELVSGPLSAGPTEQPGKLDPTINATYLYKDGKIFAFGYYSLKKDPSDNKVHFIADVRGVDDLVRPGSRLDLNLK
jgi:alkaline phosphatase D